MTATGCEFEEEEALRQCLARNAPDVFGAPTDIVRIERSRFELVTSYDVYTLRVRLANRAEQTIFLKDFGFSARPKDNPSDRRERELHVYQGLLHDAGIGTPRYYGSVWDETAGRYWMLLEFVDGTPVGYLDLPDWEPGAAGLGRMHGHFSRQLDRLRNYDFLVRYDAEYLASKADEALRDVGQIAPHEIERLRPLVLRYCALVPIMLDQPQTLLQGGCRATNILVRIASDRSRVCILDWEEAALGPPLVDVAHLLDGIESPIVDPLFAAYRREALAGGLCLPDVHDMTYHVECFRLYMVMNSLSRAVAKGFKEKGIVKLLSLGERISETLSKRAS